MYSGKEKGKKEDDSEGGTDATEEKEEENSCELMARLTKHIYNYQGEDQFRLGEGYSGDYKKNL